MEEYLKNKNILCVDDDGAVLRSYRQILAPEDDSAADIVSLALELAETGSGSDSPSRAKYDLHLASSGEEAIRIVTEEFQKGNRMAAGFFDMRMPGGIDGCETLKRIREIDPNILCAVVTAYSDRSLTQIRDIFPPACQDELLYFRKPFNPEELEQAALNLVSGWNRKRKVEEHARYIERSRDCFKQVLDIVGILSRTPPHSISYLLAEILHQILKLLGSRNGYIGIYDERGDYMASYCAGNFSEKEVVPLLRDKEKVRQIIGRGGISLDGSSCYIPLVCAKFNLGVIYFEADAQGQGDLIREVFDLFRYQITQLILNSLYYDKIVETKEEALTDPLTGLYNRRFLLESLKAEVSKAYRFNTSVSILMIDVDGFKGINDTHGHIVGDQVLVTIGQIITDAVRNYDLTSHIVEQPISNGKFTIRYGGDEFAVVLTQTDKVEACIVADRIRRRVDQHLFQSPNGPLHVTVSVGVGSIGTAKETTHGEDVLGVLFHRADQDLYQEKMNKKGEWLSKK